MFYGTSTISLTVASSGSFSLSTQDGLSWASGDKVVIWSASAPANFIYGAVTSYDNATGDLVFTASFSGGSGSHSDWRINLASGAIQQRHGLASEWVAANPVLLKAEIGVAKDDLGDGSIRFKIGDGVNAWTDLPYQGTGAGVGVYAGTAALSSGSVVVAATFVDADTVVVATGQAAPGVAGKQLYVDPADHVVGTSFTIRSEDGTDARNVFWMAAPPNPPPPSPPPSNKAMKSNAASADAYITKDLGSAHSDIWITFDLAFESAALDFWDASSSGSGYFVNFVNDVDAIIALYLNNALAWVNDGVNGHTDASPAPVASTWQHIEYHMDRAAGHYYFYIDGTLVFTSTFTPGTSFDLRAFLFGQEFSNGDAAEVAYFKNIKIGTTRESDDLFSEDFSGDLSAWDVTGDCTIVTDPYPPTSALYVTWRAKFDAEELGSSTFNSAMLGWYKASGADSGDLLGTVYPNLLTNQWVFQNNVGGNTVVGETFVADTWYDLGLKIEIVGGVATYTPRVGGVEQTPFTDSPVDNILSIDFGARYGVIGTNHRNLDDLKIGTTGWDSTDVFSADFASSIVPPFDSQTGSGISIDSGTLLIDDDDPAYAVKDISFP